MPDSSVVVAGQDRCQLEVLPHIWDLHGTMHAEFFDASNPPLPVGFIEADQTLEVVVTVELAGKILNYLCETTLCVCLAFEACGRAPSGDFCEQIYLTGPNSPCKVNTWVFRFTVPPNTFEPGQCGREYHLCITLGSRDCCGKVGFVYGSCDAYRLTVTPSQTDEDDSGVHPDAGGGAA